MLDVRNVSYSYNGTPVLADVSFTLNRGEWLGVLGPNGAGKTTLARLCCRLLRPDAGSITIDGATHSLRENARRVALLPQEAAWEFDFSCLDVVAMGRYPHLGLLQPERDADRRAVEDAMRRTGTWDLRARGIREVSGGERQRVLLARALAQEAPLLLLDEPTAHLDLKHQLDLLRHVRALVNAGGHAVLSTFHDVAQAATVASRLLVLDRGRVVADGPPAEVVTAARVRETFGVDAFVGRHPETGAWLVHPR